MHSSYPFLPSSLSFMSFVLRSQSVRMQENRYRHFSLIKAFQSQSGGREGQGGGPTEMLCVYLLLFCSLVESYHFSLGGWDHFTFIPVDTLVIIVFVSNYTLWRMCSVMQCTLKDRELKQTCRLLFMQVLFLQSGWLFRENSLIQREEKHCSDITGSITEPFIPLLYITCVFGYLGNPIRRAVIMHVGESMSLFVCLCIGMCSCMCLQEQGFMCLCEVFLDG